MLFLIDVDHGSFEKAKETRQINLQAATVSLQVVISLCKRKETAVQIVLQNRRLSSNLKIAHEIICPSQRFFSFPGRGR